MTLRYRRWFVCAIVVLSLFSVRLRAYADSNLEPLVEILVQLDDASVQRDILRGIQDAVEGRRRVTMPKSWKTAYPKLRKSDDRVVLEQSTLLAAIFQDERAIKDLGDALTSTEQPIEWRRTALKTLVQMRTPTIQGQLQALATKPNKLRGDAIRNLAAFDDAKIPTLLLGQYATLTPAERQDTINALCSRTKYARALWAAIEANDVSVDDLSAFAVRQLMALDDAAITKKLERAWGTLRSTPADRRERIAHYKAMLSAADIGKPDLAAGERVFKQTCAGCHQIFGAGGKIGPNLTGAQRTNIGYVLENLIDPNALIGRDYRMTTIVSEGRVISGLVSDENDAVLTIRTPTDTIKIPIDEIEARKMSKVSMMPEGMLDKLSREEIRDLVAYLAK